MFEKYIGIPFKSQGKDFDGVDCYNLIKLVYKNELNIDLPPYYIDAFDCDKVAKAMQEEETSQSHWIKVDEPQLFDLVLMRFNHIIPNHVGIYVGNGNFLHARQKTNSCITNISSPAWKKNIYGFYRYKEVN